MQRNLKITLEDFLRSAADFHLGKLPTESRHPDTLELSRLAEQNIPEAVRILKDIDLAAVSELKRHADEIHKLGEKIRETLAGGSKIFLCGCGATGRLSLSLEYLWRLQKKGKEKQDSVISFMAGGDLALIHSIESFEDFPEFGAKQLDDLGFQEGDLLISTTEGGETPFVIGATEHAAGFGTAGRRRKPYFLYCNPTDTLRAQIERSRRVIENQDIEKISLFVGPMSLSGSTRLQASTVLMGAVGLALLQEESLSVKNEVDGFLNTLRALDFGFLVPFIEKESRIYKDGGYVLYETDKFGITILTDTTERAPTFSLRPFENKNDFENGVNTTPSLCYLSLLEADSAENAWQQLLQHEPRPLDWPEIRQIAGMERLMGFDFSRNVRAQREGRLREAEQYSFRITRPENGKIRFELDGLRHEIEVKKLSPLFEQLLLKILLNIHSTLVMGRLKRYESNIMIWVKPSNRKLIDRSIRYVDHLLKSRGRHCAYEKIARALFQEMENLKPDEAVVLKTLAKLTSG